MKREQYIIKVSDISTVKSYAKIALDAKLYINEEGYVLRHVLKDMSRLNTYEIYKWRSGGVGHSRPMVIVALCYAGGRVVGALVLHKYSVDIYTEPSYRGKGVATQMFVGMSKKYDLSTKVCMYTDTVEGKALVDKLGIGNNFIGIDNKNKIHEHKLEAILQM